MAGILRLNNTGTGNGQSTITTAASGDTTYTLPSGGGTFVTTGSTQALTVPFASGTAGAPSVTFIGDTDTGLYSPSANNVAISTNGSGRLFINSTGSVSVGTATAQSLFHLSQNGIADLRFTDPGEATDQKNWVFQTGVGIGTGTFRLRAINDANSSGENAYLITRSGASIQTHQWLTAGSERMRLDSSGRLGLGTSSPRANIEIVSGSTNTAGEAVRVAYIVGATVGTETEGLLTIQSNDSVAANKGGSIAFGGRAVSASTAGANWATINGYKENASASDYAGYLAFSTRTGAGVVSERLRIDSQGRVGIGTTSVSNGILHIKSNGTGSQNGLAVEASANDSFLSVYNNGSAHLLNATYSSTGSYQPIAFLTGGSERGRWDTSGRFLVGTSSYAGNGRLIAAGNTGGNAGTLDICWTGSRPTAADTDIGYIRWYSADNSSSNAHYANIYASSDGASSSGSDIPGRLVFSTTADGASTPTERVRINSTGRLMCGRDGRDATLGTDDQFIISGNGYTAYHSLNATAYTIGQDSNSRALRIGSGSGWATTGVSLAAGGTSWGTYSDERLKQDIAELDGCLNQLSGIRCVTYRLKDVDEPDSKKRLGVIAQDLKGKFDEALNASRRTEDDENEYLSVQYADLVPVLIKSLQEAKERIETLEAKVAAFEGV